MSTIVASIIETVRHRAGIFTFAELDEQRRLAFAYGLEEGRREAV